jgi:hypothetical protein
MNGGAAQDGLAAAPQFFADLGHAGIRGHQ